MFKHMVCISVSLLPKYGENENIMQLISNYQKQKMIGDYICRMSRSALRDDVKLGFLVMAERMCLGFFVTHRMPLGHKACHLGSTK
jgi:hypothetical protein